MTDWHTIDTVFLDMDGTLLDLYFDSHFWQEHLPRRYAQKHGIDIESAKAELLPRFRAVEGTIDWYCLDYWSRELELDIVALKHEVSHLIAVHPYVIEFLEALRTNGKRTVLVTNAHHKSLNLKVERTRIDTRFDAVISAHELGLPKEEPAFWRKLQRREPFAPARTLLIDDSLPVLRSARRYGIRHLLAVHRPDSRGAAKDVAEFNAVRDFRDIMPTPAGAHQAQT